MGTCGGVAAMGLLQNRDLAGAVHDRQFVGEAFFLSDRHYALFVLFFCFVYQLDGLPEGYVPLISESKDTIQKT